MSESGGGVEHKGLLIRGADGGLWFMRDDSNAPEKVDEAMTNRINNVLQNISQKEGANVLPQAAIDILRERFGPFGKEGVIHQIIYR
jgi:hypothetical protein